MRCYPAGEGSDKTTGSRLLCGKPVDTRDGQGAPRWVSFSSLQLSLLKLITGLQLYGWNRYQDGTELRWLEGGFAWVCAPVLQAYAHPTKLDRSYPEIGGM